MDDCKISVIVPVYNVEGYLHKCVDSILAQSHRNLEIILVDDGSKDGSPKICDEYAAKDERVKAVHKKNGGVASARNAGLEVCAGDYIIFADSDDWLEPNMYEELLRVSLEQDSDYVSCSCFLEYETGEQAIKGYDDLKIRFMNVNEYFENYLKGDFFLTVWNRLCKREVCLNVKFPERNETAFCEDGLIAIPTLLNAKRIVFLSRPLYHYYQRMEDDSIVRGKITLPKIRSWFMQLDSWFAYSKSQGGIFNKLILNKYKDIVRKFTLLIRRKTKIPLPQNFFSFVPYSWASFIARFLPKG